MGFQQNGSNRSNITKIAIVAVIVAMVGIGFVVWAKTKYDDSSADKQTIEMTTTSSRPAQFPGSTETNQVPEGWVPEGAVRPTAPPTPAENKCSDGNCGGNQSNGAGAQGQVNQWLPTAEGFSQAFGLIGDRTQQQWADDTGQYTISSLNEQMRKVNFDRAIAGSRPSIRVADDSRPQTVVVKVDYFEGWSMYVELQYMSVGQGWKVVSYEPAKS